MISAEKHESRAWALGEIEGILSQNRKGDNKVVRQILTELVSQAHKNLPKK
jgi:hypothetical protein